MLSVVVMLAVLLARHGDGQRSGQGHEKCSNYEFAH
jgi:hypothetical protein